MSTFAKHECNVAGTVARGLVTFVTLATPLFLWLANATAQDGMVRREYAIKAGVIAVLGKCVTWPADVAPASGAPLVIGVLGKDPFVENGVNQLERLAADESRKGVNIVVKRFASLKDYQSCHILFVSELPAEPGDGKSTAERVAAAKKALADAPVLIVGESDGLARQGVVANLMFDPKTNLIRLELNPDAAARSRLKLAPDLLRLKLVQIVRDTNG